MIDQNNLFISIFQCLTWEVHDSLMWIIAFKFRKRARRYHKDMQIEDPWAKQAHTSPFLDLLRSIHAVHAVPYAILNGEDMKPDGW